MPSSRPTKTDTMSPIVGFVVRTRTTDRIARPVHCPDCEVPLDLIQPDEAEPSRLIGICDHCSKWVYLIDLATDRTTSLMIELPSGEALLRELAKGKASGEGQPGPRKGKP